IGVTQGSSEFAGDKDTVNTDCEIVAGSSGADTITAGAAGETLNGNGGDDTLTAFGTGAGDVMNGGDGNDVFFAINLHADTLDGGNGTDTAHVDLIDVVTAVETISYT